MNFANVTDWRIPEGDVIRVTDTNNTRVIWEKSVKPGYDEPFYVENTTSTTKTVHIKKNSDAEPGIMVQRSDDRTHWYDIAKTSTSGLTITLSKNQKVWLRANASLGWNRTGYGHNIYGSPKVGGNIMSLIYGSEFKGYETSFLDDGRMEFLGLFKSDTVLKNITNLILPVITMGESCYEDLFNGCTNLNTVPIIDAEILSNNCFMSMFEGCTSLLTAPVLKATSLAQGCYLGMFQGCTSLVNAPQLPATVLARSCYGAMFEGCTSLVNAPDLPASTLVQDCYDGMFEQCRSLNNIKCLATSGVNQNNLTDWTLRVSSAGTFTKAAGVTWPTGTSGIPSGWTVVEQ